MIHVIWIAALALTVLAIAFWAWLRERRGDWGPGFANLPQVTGYAPTDLRGAIAVPTPVEDPTERWLLGLAAPFVEQAGLVHQRWSLVPAFCDEAWKRRLASVATSWEALRARQWRMRVDEYERKIGGYSTHESNTAEIDLRPWFVAHYAMILRLGVAARHISGSQARKRLTRAAAALRPDYSDWLGYAGEFVRAGEYFHPGNSADLRSDIRTLYAPEGPWHELSWPDHGNPERGNSGSHVKS